MSDSIKLLQIGKRFFPDLGGIETVTRAISDTLLAHGIQADVLCTGSPGATLSRDFGYRVIRCRPTLTFGNNKSLSLDYVRQVRSLDRDYDAALVHLPNPEAAAAVLSFWAKPVILLWHADIPQRAVRTLCAPLDRLLIRRAQAIIGPTPGHVEGSRFAAVIAAKSRIIHFPFDRAHIPPHDGRSAAAARVRDFLGARRMALSIGRLVPYKGYDVLVEAARHFADGLAAVVAGNGPLLDELRALAQARGVTDRILFLGRVGEDELADLLDLAHVGCLPSVTAAEMYGMVQVETMAAGKPMVSTRLARSGVPYINRDGETGLLVEPGDAEGLAAALNRIISDDGLYRHLADGAKAAFDREHDKGPTSRAYADLVREVLALPPGHSIRPR